MKKSLRSWLLCNIWLSLRTADTMIFMLAFLLIIVSNNGNAQQKITISNPDWPPFYIDQNLHGSQLGKGFAWDVLDLCTRKIPLNPFFEQYPIRRMFREMEQGALHLNIMSYKKDRELALEYGKEVVFTNSYGLWTRTGLAKTPQSFRDLDSLKIAELVGLRTSDEYRKYLDNRLKLSDRGRVSVLSTTDAIAKMLAYGRVDAAVTSNSEMRFRLKKLSLAKKVLFSNLTITTQDYFFVIAKKSVVLNSNPDVLRKLDQCVSTLKQNGTLKAMSDRYEL